MEKLSLYVFGPDGKKMMHDFRNINESKPRVTNKTRNEALRFDYRDPSLFQYVYMGNGKNLMDDKIEFYISQPGSMKVDPRFKLETIKYKDLPILKDNNGRDVYMEGSPVRYYQFKLNRPEVKVKVLDQFGDPVPYAVAINRDLKKYFYNFTLARKSNSLLDFLGSNSGNERSSHKSVLAALGLNATPLDELIINAFPADKLKVFAVNQNNKSKITADDLDPDPSYEILEGAASELIKNGQIILRKNARPPADNSPIGTQNPTENTATVQTQTQIQTQTTTVNSNDTGNSEKSTPAIPEHNISIVQNDKSKVVKMGGWLLGLFLLGKIVFSSDEKQKGMNNPDKIKTIEI